MIGQIKENKMKTKGNKLCKIMKNQQHILSDKIKEFPISLHSVFLYN